MVAAMRGAHGMTTRAHEAAMDVFSCAVVHEAVALMRFLQFLSLFQTFF